MVRNNRVYAAFAVAAYVWVDEAWLLQDIVKVVINLIFNLVGVVVLVLITALARSL